MYFLGCNDIVSNITNVKVPPVPIVSYEEINMDSGKQKKCKDTTHNYVIINYLINVLIFFS